MADHIVRLVPKQPPSAVNDEAVAHLEMLLEKAKAGEINGVMTATVRVDHRGACFETATGWAGSVRDAVNAALGTVDVLHQRMLRELVEWRT
jgi:hypothetical protein